MTNNETVKPETSKSESVFQIVLSLLLFAGFTVFLFFPNAADGSTIWEMVLGLFKGDYAGQTFLQAALYCMVGFYAVLLICTIVSIFTKKTGSLALNYIKTFVAIAAVSLLVFGLKKDAGLGFSEILLSDKTFVALNSITFSLALAALGMIVLNFSAYKGRGVLKFIFALFAAAFFVFAKKFTFVDDYTFVGLFGKLELGAGTAETIAAYAFNILAWGAVANLGLSLLTLMLPRTTVLDLIRSIAMFAIAAFALVMLGVYGSFSKIFDHIGTVGFTGLALAQLVYAIVVTAVLHSANKKREAQREADEDGKEAAELSQFVFDSDNQMAVKGLEAPAEQQAEEQPVQDAQAAEEAARANDAFEDAAQISIDDIAAETAKEEAEAAAQEELAAEEASEEAFDFEQAKYDGKFNRAYADFAAQEESLKQAQQQQAQQEQAEKEATQPQQQQTPPPFYGYPNYQQTPPPYYGAGYAQPYGGQPYGGQPAGNGYYNMGFIPDMFLSSLTPAERDEFDRLFVSRIYGDNKRLPAYTIGGDNREFFTKVFVFMGRYRNVISDSLLEKIYNYSSSLK